MNKPTISIIAAMDRNRVIGRDNKLPWHLPADLAHFKRLTMDKPMIMGRKTWESLPGLLPGRPHIVVTRNRDYVAQGARLAHSLDEAIAMAAEIADEVMIIGGANLYQQALALADRLYLTRVDTAVEGDAWFPVFDQHEWALETEEACAADARNVHAYCFLRYRRAQAA